MDPDVGSAVARCRAEHAGTRSPRLRGCAGGASESLLKRWRPGRYIDSMPARTFVSPTTATIPNGRASVRPVAAKVTGRRRVIELLRRGTCYVLHFRNDLEFRQGV